MHKLAFKKQDGRDLFLYARRPLSGDFEITSPKTDAARGMPHLRWHPLREEWVAYAAHRQNRTFMPPPEYNPLAPTRLKELPTELPAGDYDIAVFTNLFASLDLQAMEAPELIVPTRTANGHCEVVVFAQDPDTTLAAQSVESIHLLLDVWADRHADLSHRGPIQYVMPFENRGAEMGVTLHHPHGQIYAYPFIPPVPSQMLQAQKHHWQKTGQTLLQDLIKQEKSSEARVVVQSEHSIAFVPACARYPYEIWLAPQRPVPSLVEMSRDERRDFARTLQSVLRKYENLWRRPFPYLMLLYAAPTDREPHPEWHFHVQFYPPYRDRDRLKFLAGTELGAGLFVNDSLPEEKAAELRAVEVESD